MASIYIARKDVGLIGEHSYYVFDPDGDPESGDERIIRGGPVNDDGSGGYIIEADRAIVDSRDALNGSDPYADRYYTTVFTGDTANVEVIWNQMVTAAKAVGNEVNDPNASQYSGEKVYILPEDSYYLFDPNCNTLTRTVAEAVDLDVIANLPMQGGDIGSGPRIGVEQFIGIASTFNTKDNDQLSLYAGKKAVFDQGGEDTYNYDVGNFSNNSDGPIFIYEDGNATTTDKIAIYGVDESEIRFLRGGADGNDLYIYLPGSGNQPAIIVKDQFDGGAPKIGLMEVYAPGASTPTTLPLHVSDNFPWLAPNPVSGWVPGIIDGLNDAAGMLPPPPMFDPLILDLDGDGVELAALNAPGSVYWDIDLDGFAEASAWVTGGDGWLAIDLNEDGFINDQTELFGDTPSTANGFETLDTYDTNNDGLITSSDAQFGDLLVWMDANADGYSQSGELHTLSSLGITSINLGYSTVNYNVSGNQIAQESTFTMNGVAHTIADGWLLYDNVNSVYAGDVTIDVRTLFLPTLRGYGNLPDLHIAMSLDETLLELVQEVATADSETLLSNAFDIEGKMEAILYRWAGVDDVNPASRGTFIDARQLEFLEELIGREWVGYLQNQSPYSSQTPIIKKEFQAALSELTAQILSQTDAREILGSTALYNPYSGEITNASVDRFYLSKALSTLAGTNVNELYFWSTGDGTDTIADAGGNDAILFGSEITNANIRLWNTNDGNLRIYVGSGYIQINDQYDGAGAEIEKILFADGSSIGLLENLVFTGTDDPETVYGLNDSDDTLSGLEGSDTLRGLTGNDTYIRHFNDLGDTDKIYDTGGSADVLQLGDGFTASDVRFWNYNTGDLKVFLKGTTAGVMIYDQFDDIGAEVETLRFHDGATINLTSNLTFTGNAGAETVYGLNNSDDTLSGLEGSDTLRGLTGNDTYIRNFNDLGDTDKIYDTGGSADALQLGEGFTASDVRLWSYNNGDLMVFLKGTTAGVMIYDQFDGIGAEVETLRFHDGSTINLTGNLTFTGNAGAETVYGLNNSDDILSGLEGSDTLRGLTGNDTYIRHFNDLGDTDKIYDTGGSADMLQLGEGFTTSDIRLWNYNNGDLMVFLKGTTAGVMIYDQFDGIGAEVETLRFHDGSTINLASNLTFTGSSSNENVYGVNDNNVLKGMAGSDNLYGYDGNDVLYGGAGTDKLYGGNGIDTFAWLAADLSSSFLDTVYDFSKSGGEKIDISDVLDVAGYDPLTDVISNFVRLSEGASSTTLYIDVTGAGSFSTSNDVAVFSGVTDLLAGGSGTNSTASDLQNLISSGTIVV